MIKNRPVKLNQRQPRMSAPHPPMCMRMHMRTNVSCPLLLLLQVLQVVQGRTAAHVIRRRPWRRQRQAGRGNVHWREGHQLGLRPAVLRVRHYQQHDVQPLLQVVVVALKDVGVVPSATGQRIAVLLQRVENLCVYTMMITQQ